VLWAERLSDLFARCALSILAVACSIYSARQSRRALGKKPTVAKKSDRSERKTPDSLFISRTHLPLEILFLGKNTSDARGRNFFLAASSVCLLIHDEAIRGYNSARLFSNAGRYLAKAKERAVTSSSAASRTHTFERTHPPDTMAEETETFAFQAEINQLLSLIINVSTSPPRHARFPTPPMPAI
jgi:hypothetical protein